MNFLSNIKSDISNIKSDIKNINKLAIPILAGCLVQTIFSFADQAIIGRTNIEGFAAVGVAANILYVLTGALGMLAASFSILFGQKIILENKNDAERIFNTSINITLIFGVIFAIISIFFSNIFFKVIYNLNGSTLQYATNYMKIACWSVCLNMILFIFSAYCRHLKKMKVYFYSTLIALTVNFIFDYILVFGKFGFPELGVQGAAIGTILGLLANVLIYLIVFIKSNFIKYKLKIYKEELSSLIKIYIPLLGQEFIESTLFVMIITSIITTLNVKYIAVYNLTESINSIITMPIYIYSGAISPFIIQSCAKNDCITLKKYPIIATIISLICLIIAGGLIIIFSQEVCRLITNDFNLINLASSLLPLSILIQIFNIPNQIYKHCLQSTSNEKWVFGYSTIISSFTCIILYILVVGFNGGILSVYIGLGFYYLLLSLGYISKFLNKIKKYNFQ